MPVYFIQAGKDGPIKIGFATNLAKRLSAIQVTSPVRLKPLAQLEGSCEMERELHQRFRPSRIVGEWFEPTAELLALVATAVPMMAPKERRPMVVPPLLDIPPSEMNASEHLEAARASLLAEIALFLGERNITETTFGRLAVNDGKFVARLRSTENMTTGLIGKAHDFIRAERAKASSAAPASELRAAS